MSTVTNTVSEGLGVCFCVFLVVRREASQRVGGEGGELSGPRGSSKWPGP